jgi:hypothetical protein
VEGVVAVGKEEGSKAGQAGKGGGREEVHAQAAKKIGVCVSETNGSEASSE